MVPHWKLELLFELLGKSSLFQPVRVGFGARNEDDFIRGEEREGILDRLERIGIADGRLRVPTMPDRRRDVLCSVSRLRARPALVRGEPIQQRDIGGGNDLDSIPVRRISIDHCSCDGWINVRCDYEKKLLSVHKTELPRARWGYT